MLKYNNLTPKCFFLFRRIKQLVNVQEKLQVTAVEIQMKSNQAGYILLSVIYDFPFKQVLKPVILGNVTN